MQSLQDTRHTVELNGDQNIQLFLDNHSKFTKIRVVAHTMGAWPNSQMSDNHVSIYLILEDGGSVRINMSTEEDDTRGILIWSQLAYQLSSSAIWHYDYPLGSALEVAELYRFIRNEWGLHRYQFSGGGSGCRYWVYTLLRYMAYKRWMHENVPAHAWEHLSIQYSRAGETRRITIRQGQFLSYQEWYAVWTEEEDD